MFYLDRTSIIMMVELIPFLCDQNKKGKIITIVMYIGVHNQDKPLPAGSLD